MNSILRSRSATVSVEGASSPSPPKLISRPARAVHIAGVDVGWDIHTQAHVRNIVQEDRVREMHTVARQQQGERAAGVVYRRAGDAGREVPCVADLRDERVAVLGEREERTDAADRERCSRIVEKDRRPGDRVRRVMAAEIAEVGEAYRSRCATPRREHRRPLVGGQADHRPQQLPEIRAAVKAPVPSS